MNPRRHHYCPAGYLANFSVPSERKGKLFVTCNRTGKDRPSIPNNEAHKRDYYKIDIEPAQGDQWELEKEIGKIESKALSAIRQIIQKGQMPKGEDLEWIINLVGLLSAGVPSKREHTDKSIGDLNQLSFLDLIKSKRNYDHQMEKLKLSGYSREILSFETMRELILNKSFQVKPSQNKSILLIVETASRITDLLHLRNWHLVLADTDKEFITSDNPVILKWAKGCSVTLPPGYLCPNTEVLLSLSPRHLMVGTFEPSCGKISVDANEVCSFNRHLFLTSKRWLYSRSGNPCILDSKGQIGSLRYSIPKTK